MVETDHANLKWLLEGNRHTGRLARLVLRLQEFNFRMKHKAGRLNTNADTLTRVPTKPLVSSPQVVLNMTKDNASFYR